MPVVQAVKFEFVINLKTSKALGRTIPSGVGAVANEVIAAAEDVRERWDALHAAGSSGQSDESKPGASSVA